LVRHIQIQFELCRLASRSMTSSRMSRTRAGGRSVSNSVVVLMSGAPVTSKTLLSLRKAESQRVFRRIIAVTGEDAHEVQRVAEEFSGKLEKLEKMHFGPSKEHEAKITQLELNNLSISAVKKSQLRERFAKISKEILDQQKKLQKEELKRAIDTVTEYFEKNPKAHGAVLRLPIGGSAKIVPDVTKHLQTKLKEKSVYVVVADEKDPDGKVYHGCFVGQDGTKAGLKASDWSSSVSTLVGGKAGGKAPVAIGTGTDQSKVDEALKAATEYLEKFKL